MDSLLLFILTAGVFASGWVAVRAMWPQGSRIALLALSYPIGAGLLSFLLFGVSWSGVEIRIHTILIAFVLLLAGPTVIYWLRRTEGPAMNSSPPGTVTSTGASKLDLFALIFIFGASAAAAYFAVERSYSTWDAMGIWAIKGYGIVQEGTIYAARDWGSHGLSYPLNLPLQIATYRIASPDMLAGSKLIFPIYYFSLLVGIYAFISPTVGRAKALAAVLFLGTVPILFEHATIGYANLPFSYYLVMGFISLQPANKNSTQMPPLLSGVLLGLGTWTRPEGIFLVLAGLGIIFLTCPWSKATRHFWMSIIAGLMLFALPWQVFSAQNVGGGLLGRSLGAAMTGWSSNDFHLDALYWTARYAARQAIEPSVWGLLFPAGALLFVMNINKLKCRDGMRLPVLIWLSVSLAAAVFVYYYLASYSNDVQYLLGTSVNRIFMPAWVLGFLGVLCLQGDR